jgi:hypothetical protein
MSTSTESLIKELDTFLGNKPYFTGTQLIEIGLFGSASAVTSALKKGLLPSIKISPKRTIVPRSAVVKYFRENLLETTV